METQWDQIENALSVKRFDISGGYQSQERTQAKDQRHQVAVCDFPVKNNGTTIDNSKEPYPLLMFRDITYFPMTWAYGVEQFGWQYQFKENAGLSIVSDNLKPVELGLDVAKFKEPNYGYDGDYGYLARLVGDYCYYQGADGIIYQAPVQRMAETLSFNWLK